jgi:hypothetical protein
MSELSIQIATPAGAGSIVPEVPRSFEVGGTIAIQLSPRHGPVTRKSVAVQFGDAGPSLAASFTNPNTWLCTGAPLAAVPAGSTINITVTASATVRFFHNPFEPDLEDLDAQAVFAVHLANPAPVLSIDAFAPELSAAQLPLPFTLAGGTTDPDGNLASVQCALDTGDFELADNLSGEWSRWQKTLMLSAGLHRFIVRALDQGGNQAQLEQFVMVRAAPEPVDAHLGSVTSWTRLEPSCRDAAMTTTLGARVFDPLWLLARQWQMGEFQGADAGTPVQARVRCTSAMLSRCHFGELAANTNAQAPRYDALRAPLETMVERRRMRAANADDSAMLPLAVEAALHFLRMLETQLSTTSYRAAFVSRFALLPLPADVADAADEATRRFAQAMSARAPDARRLAAALRNGGAAALVQDAALQIAGADRDKVQHAAVAWLAWYDGLFAEPAGPADDAWTPERLEYAVTVSASFSEQPQDQVNLGASEIDEGRLDWSNFDCDLEVNLASHGDRSFRALTETTLPAPVSFRGAPAVRFWEIEDSRLAYGLLPVGPTDLAHMMLIEYAGSYGNDWFVVPLALPVGSINRVDSLVVTDSFGVRTLLNPIGKQGMPSAGFSMWQHAVLRRPGSDLPAFIEPNLFFLAPALGRAVEGAALEDVLFMRDEMANVAWAIERSTESPVEQARIYSAPASPPGDAVAADAPARYLLSSTVPENWIALLPVQLRTAQGQVVSRLKRGAVLQADGPPTVHRAQSQALNAAADLLLHDEDVPREGVHVTRARRMARWIDGSTWVWTAFRKQVGRGEGSSGLQFDQLRGPGGGQG